MKRLAAADPAVHAHLVEEQVDPQYFAFRWITVLFAHDIERLEEVQRVWDFLLGDPSGCKDAIMRFCAALVLVRLPRATARYLCARAVLAPLARRTWQRTCVH